MEPYSQSVEIVAALMEYPPYHSLSDTQDMRLTQAKALVKAEQVHLLEGGAFEVESTEPGKRYLIHGACPCPDACFRPSRGLCKHMVAVALWKRVQQHRNEAPTPGPGMCRDEQDHSWIRTSLIERCIRCFATRPFQGDAPMNEQTAPDLPTEAINLTSAVPGERPIASILADLAEPLPETCVATLERKGTKIRYLHWTTVAQWLDFYAPGWEGTITRLETAGGKVVVTYRITLHATEGTFSREATGQEDAELGDKEYGDSTSNAEAMAFKRAAAKFGVGAYLYDKDGARAAMDAHMKTTRLAFIGRIDKLLEQAALKREEFWPWVFAAQGSTRLGHLGLGMLHGLWTRVTWYARLHVNDSAPQEQGE